MGNTSFDVYDNIPEEMRTYFKTMALISVKKCVIGQFQ